jgi:hypothetical protein
MTCRYESAQCHVQTSKWYTLTGLKQYIYFKCWTPLVFLLVKKGVWSFKIEFAMMSKEIHLVFFSTDILFEL